MADIKPIKPIKLCVNITIPTIDDDSISLYECVGILGNKLQEAIQKINESLGSLEGAYTAVNPPPYPVTSVNGKTGAVVIDIPANVYTEDNPPPYPVTSVNRAETKDVITVFEPEGGSIEDVSQAELIAACKAGARLGAFNQDDGTCRLYHFNLYIDPERVDYKEVAGGGASGVISVNDQTGAVNIFNAPISAATAESVTALNTSTNTKINQLKDDLTAEQTSRANADQELANDIGDAWTSGTTYAVGDYCISANRLYKCKTAHTAGSVFNADYWDNVSVSGEIKAIQTNILQIKVGNFYDEKINGHTMPELYGRFLRIGGTSWPGTGAADTYYIGVGADGHAYAGMQLNGATEIAWINLNA